MWPECSTAGWFMVNVFHLLCVICYVESVVFQLICLVFVTELGLLIHFSCFRFILPSMCHVGCGLQLSFCNVIILLVDLYIGESYRLLVDNLL